MRPFSAPSGRSRESTKHYPPTAHTQSKSATTQVATFSTVPTINPNPLSRLVVGDRGQPVVGPGRVGPIRRAEVQRNVIPQNQDFKTAFRSTGVAEAQKSTPVVDVAHCKGMKGRFEGIGSDAPERYPCHYSYGSVPATQFGRAERPQSAERMLGFRDVCSSAMPQPPAATKRGAEMRADVALRSREIQLDNVIARAGI